MQDRATGWLDVARHSAFREIILHAAIREDLVCPIYTMMPDHVHMIWMGVGPESDQRTGTSFLRRQFERHFAPAKSQHQPFDHLLREDERARGAFAATCAYIAENPVRKGLVKKAADWPFTGCVVPGYPNLSPITEDYWELFWRIYNEAVARTRVGKSVAVRDKSVTEGGRNDPPKV
jgi:REP element-mobilizing transposase RayT